MDMYEARQRKEKVSRRIDAGRGVRQKIKIEDGRKNFVIKQCYRPVNSPPATQILSYAYCHGIPREIVTFVLSLSGTGA